jgi:acetoin utilization protein AcuB
MLAEDIMTRDPLSVKDTTPLSEAFAVLAESEIRHLPVLRDEALVGILSDRDFRALGLSLVNDVRSLDELQRRMRRGVAEVMSGNVISVDTDTPLSEVVDLFVEEKVGALPVVEPGTAHLVGIISVLDVLRASRDGFAED